MHDKAADMLANQEPYRHKAALRVVDLAVATMACAVNIFSQDGEEWIRQPAVLAPPAEGTMDHKAAQHAAVRV